MRSYSLALAPHTLNFEVKYDSIEHRLLLAMNERQRIDLVSVALSSTNKPSVPIYSPAHLGTSYIETLQRAVELFWMFGSNGMKSGFLEGKEAKVPNQQIMHRHN